MAIIKHRGNAMGGGFPPGLAAGLRSDATDAINGLDYGSLWGGAGNLTNTPLARLDLQGYTAAGQMNLQVQVNNVGPPSALAAVLVDNTAQALPPPSPRRGPQETEIVRVIKAALFESLNDFRLGNAHIWHVTGVPSS